jgi:putative transposase
MFLYLRYALTHDTMSAKFQNKYRIPTARWQSWDYSSEGLYFITINAVHHECLFGNIVNKEMHLSAYGQIVAEEWNKSFEIRTGLFCDAFVIMPNHIHAILRDDDNGSASIGCPDDYGVAFREPKSYHHLLWF